MSAFFQGVVVGLTFAVLLGPGFFSLLQTSIHSGFRAGICLSIGIFLSDVFVLLLCYFGISHLLVYSLRVLVHLPVPAHRKSVLQPLNRDIVPGQ